MASIPNSDMERHPRTPLQTTQKTKKLYGKPMGPTSDKRDLQICPPGMD